MTRDSAQVREQLLSSLTAIRQLARQRSSSDSMWDTYNAIHALLVELERDDPGLARSLTDELKRLLADYEKREIDSGEELVSEFTFFVAGRLPAGPR